MRFFPVVLLGLFFPALQAQHAESPRRSAVLSPVAKLYFQGGFSELFPVDESGKIWVTAQFSPCFTTTSITEATVYGDVLCARLLPAEAGQLAKNPCITHLEVCGRLNAPRRLNDTARVHSFVNQAHTGLLNGLSANYTGKGVVAGVVDIGFQTGHPTFYSIDGSAFRVKRFWHQNTTFGSKPAGFGYGGEFSATNDILAMRDDDGSHGTHVAGIMAGSGYTTPSNSYRGMAPEADLVFVTIKYANDTLGGSALGDYVVANPTILDGYRYVFQYAQSVGKPAVTNLSWGMHTGPHDGTSLFDRAVETLAGPGKIIVGANGNDAGHQMHVSANLSSDTAYTFAIDRNRNDYRNENIYCDWWGPAGENLGLNISVVDTLGNVIIEEPFVYSTSNTVINRRVVAGADTLRYTMACQAAYVNNGKPNILLMAETNNAGKLRMRIGITANGTVHGWNSGQTRRWTSGSFLHTVKGNDFSGKYLEGSAAGSMGENGGSGRRTISVGSYINRKEWIDANKTYRAQNWLTVGEVSGFSSRGPTPDGRMKPDVSAPGQLVASAVNNKQFAGWMEDYTTFKSQFNGETQYWTMFSGTSMAAPHAAGVIALYLQACPTLTPEQVRDILRKTATRDALTGADSNNNYGYGRINAFEGVKAAAAIQRLNRQPLSAATLSLYPVPASDIIHVSLTGVNGHAADLILTDPSGRVVLQETLMLDAAGTGSVRLGKLPSGSYFYRLNTISEQFGGTLLLLR